jgi:hypothetical protein
MSAGTEADPWRLTTAPGTSTYEMHVDPADDEVLVCQVGSTRLRYDVERSRICATGSWLRETRWISVHLPPCLSTSGWPSSRTRPVTTG